VCVCVAQIHKSTTHMWLYTYTVHHIIIT